MLLCGQWDCVVDPRWRINIPNAIRSHFKGEVLLKENEAGCIELHEAPEVINPRNAPHVFVVKILGEKQPRLTIPQTFRSATSFFLGRNVTLVGRGTHLEIWPRP
jgi:DNA-binding transcriptional regulator/RsmH inhibitor MraZ